MYPPCPVTLSHSTFLSYCGEQRQAVCRLGARPSDNSFSTFLLSLPSSVCLHCLSSLFQGKLLGMGASGAAKGRTQPETNEAAAGPPAFLSGENRSRPVKRSLAQISTLDTPVRTTEVMCNHDPSLTLLLDFDSN